MNVSSINFKNNIKAAIDKLYGSKTSHTPLCGKSYSFSNRTCTCTKKKSKTTKKQKKTKKLPRCSKGTRRNPKTMLCESTKETKVKTKYTKQRTKKQYYNNVVDKLELRLKKLMNNASSVKKTAAFNKRCPKGTRRNKKTKLCESIQKTPIIIPDSTTSENRAISTAISKLLVKNKSSSLFKSSEILSKLPHTVKRLPSFSPEINKKLVTIREDVNIHDIFGCGIEDALEKKINIQFKKKLQVPVGVNTDGSLKCVGGFTKEGQSILLDNLKQSKLLNCSTIITPLQVQSNCWFNTMFMTFFISDKGRKFFRFFRQMMITGKKIGGTTITPVNLRYAFFLLNASIEACYNKKSFIDPIKRTNWTLALDTNNLIRYIYNSIPKSKRETAIVKPGKLNNPLSYYKGIIHYLGDNSISIKEISISSPEDINLYSNLIKNGFVGAIDTPDIIAVHIMDAASKNMDKPFSFSYNNANYKLDSAVVRDTTTSHFCAVLTCNEEEYGYDGASFSRITPFNWREVFNKSKKWTFNGSVFVDSDGNPTSSKIYWNFKNGYQVLYYYRVS